MKQSHGKITRGRGATYNPDNRFDKIILEPDPEWNPAEDPSPSTILLRDNTQSIITYNDSPDVGFKAGINPYRGCEHGCVYCFARPNHEYLGFSSGIDFETKILVKENAPQLLRKELNAPRYTPQVIVMSGNTDPYQPIERKLKLTRQCLEVLADFRNPVAIITKNRLVERDVDLLKKLNQYRAVAVFISVTTLDSRLARKMEPRTSSPQDRLRAIKCLNDEKIPVGVMVAPVIPGLTDHEIPSILRECAQAGAQSAGHIIVRLPHAVKLLFEDWLERHFPDRKKKVLNRIREIRGGRLNDPNFGSRMKGEGPFAQHIHDTFYHYRRKFKMHSNSPGLSVDSFRKFSQQYTLFE